MFLCKEADKLYMDLYKKENTFLIFYKNNMYILNEKEFRKISKDEIEYLSNWCLIEVEKGKYIYERIKNDDVRINGFFSKNIQDKIINTFPKSHIKKHKEELLKLFRDKYFMKINSYMLKSKKNDYTLSFDELHKITIKDMKDITYRIKNKDFLLINPNYISKLEKHIIKDIKDSLKWFSVMSLGRFNLTLKKEIIIYKYISEKEKKLKLNKLIKNREI